MANIGWSAVQSPTPLREQVLQSMTTWKRLAMLAIKHPAVLLVDY